MEIKKTSFLTPFTSNTKLGLGFVFIAIITLAVALVASGSIAISTSLQHKARLEYAKKNSYAPSVVSNVTSNEKANPGPIAFYLNGKLTGAITEDGVYDKYDAVPAGGKLSILFLNPPNAAEPINVRFRAQSFTVYENDTLLKVCIPSINAHRGLWVDKAGNTYYDATLKARAQACSS